MSCACSEVSTLPSSGAPPLSGPQGPSGPVPYDSSSLDTAPPSLHPGCSGLSAAPDFPETIPGFCTAHSSLSVSLCLDVNLSGRPPWPGTGLPASNLPFGEPWSPLAYSTHRLGTVHPWVQASPGPACFVALSTDVSHLPCTLTGTHWWDIKLEWCCVLHYEILGKKIKECVRWVYMKSLLFDISTFDLCLFVQGPRAPIGWTPLNFKNSVKRIRRFHFA